MGACCSGCAGGGKCSGLGLFESGFDFTAWTWQEWLVVGIGGYALTSMFFGTKRAVKQAPRAIRRRTKAARRKLAARIAGD